MRRGPAAAATVALMLAACGTAPDDPGATEPTPAPVLDPPEEPLEPDDDADETDERTDVDALDFVHCDAPVYTVGHPEGWATNDPGGLLGPCELFHPEAVEEPTEPRDLGFHHAVTLSVEDVAFDEHDAGLLDEVVEEQDLTVDGRSARLVELEGSGEAMLPEGERRYAYAVDLDGQVLVAATHTIGDTDHEFDRAVLDRMVTEELVIHEDELRSGPDPLPGDATTDESVQEGDGTMLVVTDLRVGGHDGFDRITFEVAGDDAPPGWRIAYDDDPRSAGSGHEVEIAGDAVLHVSLTSFAYPFDAPAEPRDGPQRIEPERTSAIVEVLDDAIYEGHHDFWIGLDEQRPYRVALLDDPMRVVVDIETD